MRSVHDNVHLRRSAHIWSDTLLPSLPGLESSEPGEVSMSKQKKRQSDLDHSRDYERSEHRVLSRDGLWFFSSREGEMGPFETQGEAQEQLDAYVMLIDLKEENERPVTPDID